MKRLLLLLLLAGSVLAFGQEQKLVTVEARGMGASPDAATKDALSQAIQQAAGAIVDSQTLMKNDEIMQEKILTASNAIVKKYDVVVPVKQNRNGLFEIRIRAQVEQNLLRQKMVEHKIISGKVEGTQNIWAEVVTQEKNQGDMQAMIENVFDKIDFKRYLQFTLIGVGGTQGNEAKLYMSPLPNDKTKVLVSAGVACVFDAARFQKECMPHLKKIFDALPFEQKKEFAVQTETGTMRFALPKIGQKGGCSPRLSPKLADFAWKTASTRTYNGLLQVEKNCGIRSDGLKIFLNISPKYRPGSQRFVCYAHSKLDDSFAAKKWAEIGKLSVSLCLLDGDGTEVRRLTRQLESGDGGGKIVGVGFWDHHHNLVISPELFTTGGMSSDEVSSLLAVLPMSSVIDLADLKEIKSFKLEVNLN